MHHTTPPVEKAAVAPVICPACRSANTNTTSKTVDASTYWRCRQCGEVWNILRRETANRFGYRR